MLRSEQILKSLPESFRMKHFAKEYAQYGPEVDFGDDWPSYDDDHAAEGENPWSTVCYADGYHTEDGVLYLDIHQQDQWGNRDVDDSIEVDSPDYEKYWAEHFGYVNYLQEWIKYYEWVRDNGNDPLEKLTIPDMISHKITIKVEREDNKLRLNEIEIPTTNQRFEARHNNIKLPDEIKIWLSLKWEAGIGWLIAPDAFTADELFQAENINWVKESTGKYNVGYFDCGLPISEGEKSEQIKKAAILEIEKLENETMKQEDKNSG